MYRLVISPQAKKQLIRIKNTHRMAIKMAIEDIRETPQLGKLLTRNLTGKYSYRVGFYRIIYKIDEKDKVINILSAGHRSVVYD